MKKMICFLILTLGILACSSEESTSADDSFRIKFYNKTGSDIDSLIIAKNFIGHLKNENSTTFLNFKKMNFGGDQTFREISGISNNKKLKELPSVAAAWNWCGTMDINTPIKRRYFFDIKTTTNKDGSTSLFLVERYSTSF
ncbi:hypothetical protein [Flavobacterium sp. 2]|uniref:hypothetical protein n=1 Tax=Flavobacterium sp. 2 TaxID=308053 RepID=UPI003CF3FB0C